MVKQRIHYRSFLVVTLLLLGTSPLAAQFQTEGNYVTRYEGFGSGGSTCAQRNDAQKEANSLFNDSISLNLDKFKDEVVNRVEAFGTSTANAMFRHSTIMTHDFANMTAELQKTQEAALRVDQNLRVEEKTLDAVQAMTPTAAETEISTGLAMYRPELIIGARQSEMERYINELNNVPLDKKYINTLTGTPLPGYVDTSQGSITALGQEFRNFVRFFCDARSINGKLASTRFLEYNSASQSVSQYWCGQARNIEAPPVSQDGRGRFIPLEGSPLLNYVNSVSTKERLEADHGRGKGYLVNAPKNVADLYFEPHTIAQDKDVYEKAEQQFARFVIGRADNFNNTASFATGAGQRDFMQQQARIAKLALARYPFAEMFAQKVQTMPTGSAAWAANLIEQNLGDCKKPDDSYKALCDLASQLRKKDKISESEFFDVLFNRQFQGMSFSNKMVGMTSGQLKRMQVNLLALQMALSYQRNRMKEQQLALMAAIYAQQNQ